MKLKNKIAVITGAGSGMGRASAIRFAREGAKVIVTDLNDIGARETAAMIRNDGMDAAAIRTDVASEEQVINMVDTVVEKYGGLHILFNVAGCPQQEKPFEMITGEEWDHIMAVNVRGIFYTAKHALSELKKTRGVILNVGSIWSERPGPRSVCYAASKGAVLNITRALAIELAIYKIRVNCICPGATDTPFMAQTIPGYNEKIKEEIAAATPLKSIVLPEDVASAALFLVSNEASKITGSAFYVDSGYMVGRSEV
ncbi:MAG: SDR family oxidoreductase [Bacillota bacterium]|nr:SDR family oxidoreductase [Bacillota bacterium]